MQTATPLLERLVWCAECGQYTARVEVTLCSHGVWRRRVCTVDIDHSTQGKQ